jgi:dipeptidyl aminopeptidase/acylaminoacyl peptidase
MKNLFLLLFAFFLIQLQAQKKTQVKPTPVQKKVLDHSVYDSWKEITYKAITPDGKYAAFTVNPQDGDGKVVLYNLDNNQQDSVKRADNISLSWDSRYAVFKIKPQNKLVKDLRRQKKKKEDLPVDSLGVYSFANRKTEKISDVKSYKMPEKAGGWLAYLSEPTKEVKPKPDAAKVEAPKTDPPKKSKKLKKNSDDNGHTLVLRKLDGSAKFSYGYVKEYTFAKYGQALLFTSMGNDSTMKAGVYWHDLATGKLTAIHEGKPKFKYKGLTINEDGNKAAFLFDNDTTKAQVRHFQLYHWEPSMPKATLLDVTHSLSLPLNWIVSEHYTPQFSKNGQKIYFGAAPPPLVQDTTLLTEEIVQVEVWGGNDEYIYPQQNKQLETEKKRSYMAVVDFDSSYVAAIGTVDVPNVELGDEGNATVALVTTNKPYRKQTTWDQSGFSDFYVFDMHTKQIKLVAQQVGGNARLSPKAKFAYWFNEADTAWYAHRVGSDSVLEILHPKRKIFVDEENDSPDYANEYGAVGWITNDAQLLVYDRYDIWALDPKNKKQPINLTKTGRQTKTVFRYMRLDPEERNLDPNKDWILSAFDETTKAAGYYKFSMKTGTLTKLVMDNVRFGGLVKARQADKVLFTKETFREFPDVWTSTTAFATSKKISDANPQIKNYFWGTVELVNWKSADNIPLQGLLYKPESFDPKKKYPMMTYFYEKFSDNLNAHVSPIQIGSAVNRATYVSDGYLVFIPDIVYKVGYPGQSGYNCVVPGVESLIKQGFVDEKRLGIQGHSWGGYQIAYIITKTNMFAAAEAGAMVTNMISAYGGIRWETGVSRMFQYEHTQSRIGATLWEKPNLYFENSALFSADKITTPLLTMHNDADGAVPWYQGIEMYMAMRRLNKPMWLLNYNGEGHNLNKRENKIDLQIRMKQFFDYFLKNSPMPPWMKDGLPAIQKGIIKGY